MKAFWWMLAAIGLMSTMDAVAKWLAADYPVAQVVWLRYIFGLITLMPLVLSGWMGPLRASRPFGHFARSCFGLLATVFFFTAIRLLPLSLAVTLWFTAPIFVIVFGSIFLKETIAGRHALAVLLGLGGLTVMVMPTLIDASNGHADILGIAAALGAAASYAASIVLTRNMAATESQISLSFYPAVLGSLAALPLGVSGWVAPGPTDWVLFGFLGLLGSLGYIAICLALSKERAGALAPYEYSAMLWAVAYDLLVFNESVTMPTVAGAAIIIAATRIAAAGGLLPRLHDR